MASAPSISPRPPQSSPPVVPKPPLRRPAPRRAHTLLFWAVFLLFIAALGYLGLLAFSGYTEKVIPSVAVDSHRLGECLVAVATVAAVAGGIATRHHMH
jgi:hypothetical protein